MTLYYTIGALSSTLAVFGLPAKNRKMLPASSLPLQRGFLAYFFQSSGFHEDSSLPASERSARFRLALLQQPNGEAKKWKPHLLSGFRLG